MCGRWLINEKINFLDFFFVFVALGGFINLFL